jgi:hypothetical protein
MRSNKLPARNRMGTMRDMGSTIMVLLLSHAHPQQSELPAEEMFGRSTRQEAKMKFKIRLASQALIRREANVLINTRLAPVQSG